MPEGNIQFSLFDTLDRAKYYKAVEAIDELNHTMGRNTIRYAIQGKYTKISVQEMLSPEYTTKWKEILTIEQSSGNSSEKDNSSKHID